MVVLCGCVVDFVGGLFSLFSISNSLSLDADWFSACFSFFSRIFLEIILKLLVNVQIIPGIGERI
jgi:hypothetical protein